MARPLTAVALVIAAALAWPGMATAQAFLPPGQVDFYSSQVGVKFAADARVELGKPITATVDKPLKLNGMIDDPEFEAVRDDRVKITFESETKCTVVFVRQKCCAQLVFDRAKNIWKSNYLRWQTKC